MQDYCDPFGVPYTASTAASAEGMAEMIHAFMGFRRDIGDCLKRVLEDDPEMPMANCARGYVGKLMGSRSMSEMADAQLAKLEDEILPATSATDRERLHVTALRLWCTGHLDKAAEVWETILTDTPLDGLALRLAHFAWFYSGDGRRIRDSMARTLPFWPEDHPCYGFLLGMYAFGLEESGDYVRAEKFGRRAVELNNADAWSIHAVAHTMEMTERHDEGIRWIEEREAFWSTVNNFRFHLDWHASLFHLEQRNYKKVLDLYDQRFGQDVDTGYYLDFCNAASALWRLEIHGVDIGDRWFPLLKVAKEHLEDEDLAFLSVHYMMAIAAAGSTTDSKTMINHLEHWAAKNNCQGQALKKAGLSIAEAMVDLRAMRFEMALRKLSDVRYTKDPLGGSQAQRDIFDLMLLQAARGGKDQSLAKQLFAERINMRPKSSWARDSYRSLAPGSNAEPNAYLQA